MQSYIGGSINAAQNFDVKGASGYRTKAPEFVWYDFQHIADRLSHCGPSGCSGDSNDKYHIYAIDQGGTLATGEDNTCHVTYCAPNHGDHETLVVFIGAGTVCLHGNCYGCSGDWKPSVLAPYARIVTIA